jgi:glycosyltransferase involved in cell wall biosynthesis
MNSDNFGTSIKKIPLVSIIIPVFNRQEFIVDCVESAINQTYQNIEVIIVDNASTDDTWTKCVALSRQDSRIKVFRNSYNIGPVRNWVECVSKAQGEYIKILWSDDTISRTFIEETIVEMNDDVAFVYTGVKIFNEANQSFRNHYLYSFPGIYPSSAYIEAALFSKNVPVSPGCALFRTVDVKSNLLTKIENKFGINIENVAIGPDLLLFLITAHTYKNVCVINKALSSFRDHAGSISSMDSDGKLDFHYSLAKVFFVEKYEPRLKSRLHASLTFQQIIFRIRNYSYGKYPSELMFAQSPNRDIFWFFYFIHHGYKLAVKRIKYKLRSIT